MSLVDLSNTAASNNAAAPTGAPEGSFLLGDVSNTFREMMAVVRSLAASDTIAAAATTDLGSKTYATFLTLTGTATTITGLGTVSAGIYKFVVYNAAHSVTHNATSLILQGGASRTVANGDVSLFVSLGSGNWRECFYSGGSYQPLDATLTALAGVLTAANKIPYATALNTAGELDLSTNTSLGTSDTTLSSQKAVKTYIDAQVATSVADSDFTGSNQSLGTNGYQKLPGGLIFQYGRVGTDVSGSNSAASSGTVTYPIAFPTAVLYVGFTPHEPDVAGATQGLTSSLSLTQFGYSLFGATGSASAADGLHWFAVGY